MRKHTKSIKFNEFMDGSYKDKDRARKQKVVKGTISVASSVTIPLLLTGGIGAIGLAMTGVRALAATNPPTVIPTTAQVFPVGASEWMGEKTLQALAHVLDPVVDILGALSFPIASVIIVGACFLFMFNNSEKAWEMIMKAGLGYVLIQVSPLILDVLKQVGNAV